MQPVVPAPRLGQAQASPPSFQFTLYLRGGEGVSEGSAWNVGTYESSKDAYSMDATTR